MSEFARAAAEEMLAPQSKTAFPKLWAQERDKWAAIIDAAIQAATAELRAENERLKNQLAEQLAWRHLNAGIHADRLNADNAALRQQVAELTGQVETLRKALERMLSADLDWEDGEVGVGHAFRHIARKAIAQAAATQEPESP